MVPGVDPGLAKGGGGTTSTEGVSFVGGGEEGMGLYFPEIVENLSL